MISFKGEHYFTDAPEFALAWGGVLAFIAVAACYVWDVQTCLALSDRAWHHAERGPALEPKGDSGVRLELGPHEWYRRLGPHEVELVLQHWHAQGLFPAERAIPNPSALIALPAAGERLM